MLKPPAYDKIQKPLLHPPTYVTYKNKRFLIIDTPSISNMSRYLKVKLSSYCTMVLLMILYQLGV